jgi:hypothetical protein
VKDGKPQFDLDQFDESFFRRLRARVELAGDAGIYVGVMLFDGWALHLSPRAGPRRQSSTADRLHVEQDQPARLTAPFSDELAVVYLRRA